MTKGRCHRDRYLADVVLQFGSGDETYPRSRQILTGFGFVRDERTGDVGAISIIEAIVLRLSEKWGVFFRDQPETGMGYVVVSVFLSDGRRFDQAVVSDGFLTRIRGLDVIPFCEEAIDHFVVTHAKWKW